MTFTIEKTNLDDCYIIKPKVFWDQRGFFLESYNKRDFTSLGINEDFVQDNHSKSSKGVLRGLHTQVEHPYTMLVRVTKGSVIDVVVDMRKNSSSFGKHTSVILNDENKMMLLVPKGFVHGFLALSETVEFLYKQTDYYYPEYEAGIIWNDPDLGINWPFQEYGIKSPLLSKKDQNLFSFSEFNKKYSF